MQNEHSPKTTVRLDDGIPHHNDEAVAEGRASIKDLETTLAQEIEQVNRLHRRAVRCFNALERLQHLRHFADGDRLGLAPLVELQGAVQELPPVPLDDDPFCGDTLIRVSDLVSTSYHAAVIGLAKRTWQDVYLVRLVHRTSTQHRDATGASYERVTAELEKKAPTEVPWSTNVWREVCARLDGCPAPQEDGWQERLAWERHRASRRLREYASMRVCRGQPIASSAVVQPSHPLLPLLAPDKQFEVASTNALETREARGGLLAQGPKEMTPGLTESASARMPGGGTVEQSVEEFLGAYPKARIQEVMQALKISERQVQRTSAWKQAEERRLDQYLRDHPDAHSGDVGRVFGFSAAKTTGMQAWREHKKRKDAAKPDPRVKERPLTQKMFASRPDASSVNSTSEVENRDALYHSLLEASDPKTRAQLHRLSADQREALIGHLCESFNFDTTSDQPLPNAQLLPEVAKSWLEEQEDEQRHSRRQSR